MIPNPFKKGFKVQNRAKALTFLKDHVFMFDQVIKVPPNVLIVNGKMYKVHAYCESTKAMIKAPNSDTKLSTAILLVHKPYRENKVVVYEVIDIRNLDVENKCSIEWEVARNLSNRIWVVSLETGGLCEFKNRRDS